MNIDWATIRAPDAQSEMQAARVLVAKEGQGTPPVVYLMQKDGLSREQAEAVVRACQPISWRQRIARLIGWTNF